MFVSQPSLSNSILIRGGRVEGVALGGDIPTGQKKAIVFVVYLKFSFSSIHTHIYVDFTYIQTYRKSLPSSEK
jgi:hypothetical protein